MKTRTQRITKAEYEQLAAWRYSLRQFLRFSEEAAQAAGLTPQQHQALLAIKGFPGRDRVTIGELAERLQIRPHSAVGLADRLVSEKYAERLPGEQDRRQVYLSLTPHGEQVLENLTTAHREQLRRVEPHLRAVIDQL